MFGVAVLIVTTRMVRTTHLMRVVVSRKKKRDASGWQSRRQEAAQALAESLQGMPTLQAAFIRRHRDLLT